MLVPLQSTSVTPTLSSSWNKDARTAKKEKKTNDNQKKLKRHVTYRRGHE
jgi:hypothetical protein